MNDVMASISKYFNTRLRTPFYGILGFWWVVFHWEFFYMLFFVNESLIYKKTGLLKNEYLRARFYDYGHLTFWWHLAFYLLLSVGLTILMIWVVPRYVLIRAYDREQRDRTERLKVRYKYEEDLKSEQAKLEKKATKLEEETTKRLAATEQKVVQAEKVNRAKASPIQRWRNEYRQFTSNNLFARFGQLIEALYTYGGNVEVTNEYDELLFRLNRDLLAFADTNDLIVYDRVREKISLTDKGKFFVKEFQAGAK